MMRILNYLFWPLPAQPEYGDPRVIGVLILCGGLILLSFALSFWRKRVRDSVAKKLSRSWSSAAFWYGVVGLLLTVARVEGVSFLAMRVLWVLWGLALAFTVVWHVRQFRTRHYTVVPRAAVSDPRDPYLPHKKARK